jgi:hypothetical protein
VQLLQVHSTAMALAGPHQQWINNLGLQINSND